MNNPRETAIKILQTVCVLVGQEKLAELKEYPLPAALEKIGVVMTDLCLRGSKLCNQEVLGMFALVVAIVGLENITWADLEEKETTNVNPA